ncbi:hypothetical protein GCK72_023919 [Caenorhabditis remanei]|uniref:Uncharacterized protein n=1 Tax=Caenorhabditis remanei TaxID=31234 RepID=A0A6A5FY47_CAERE|nr:hypothetical protein GCK72_023919 [Caenorhabditis remanei]KAF1747457.1 hypothetical protein GCK72_023919 [Caenorhabditis remanei]
MLVEDKVEAPVGDVEQEENHWEHDSTPFVNSLGNTATTKISEGTSPVESTSRNINSLESGFFIGEIIDLK